jgi:hypothetical protein
MREFRKDSDEFRSTIETNLEINAPDPVPTPAPDPLPAESSPAVASDSGALPDSVLSPYGTPNDEAEPAPADEGEPYLAKRGAKLFHARTCDWSRKVAEVDRQYFKRVADAREAGLTPCPVCEPWEPA